MTPAIQRMAGSFFMQEMKPKASETLKVDEKLCTLCGLCVDTCPCNAMQLEADDLVIQCEDVCVSTCQEIAGELYLCEEVCPTGAISCSFEIVMELGQNTPACSGPGPENASPQNKETR